MTNWLKLILRFVRRDWRAGELRILLIALVLAVTAVTSVGFFADRVQRTLSIEASQMLGGDLRLSADHLVAPRFRDEAHRRGVATSASVVTNSMAIFRERTQLVEIKAVEAGYPLRGRLHLRAIQGDGEVTVADTPTPGTIWVAERLISALGLRVGDDLELGATKLKVARVLTREPDQAFEFFAVAPRVLMSSKDLNATQLIQPGSRVGYRLHFAGEGGPVEEFRAWATTRLGRGERLEGVRDARPEVRNMLERAGRFLNLTAVCGAVLAAVAIGLAARRYSERHFDTCATLRCLGARSSAITAIFFGQILLLGMAASLMGGALGFAIQYLLAKMLSGSLNVTLVSPTLIPWMKGVMTGMVLIAGFALPPVLRLRNSPPIRVYRRDVGVLEPLSLVSYLAGYGALVALLIWFSAELKLAAYVVAGFSLTVLTAVIMAWALVRLLRRLKSAAAGTWRYGLANITRHVGGSVAQIAALSAGVMALLCLTFVRDDLLERWKERLPSDAPNRFVINIQPDQVEPVRQFFRGQGLTMPDIYPLVRGRLATLNGKSISADQYEDPSLKRQVEREFNLTWAKDVQAGHTIVEGKGWGPGNSKRAQFSAEKWIADRIGIRVGDRLGFTIAGSLVEAEVTSIRKVDWDSMKPNFYIIASPGLLDGAPTSNMTGLHLESSKAQVINELVSAFPNLTVIDVAAIIEELRRMIDQVSRAVRFVFLFAVLAGLLVLWAALETTQDVRRLEAALLRTLGASRSQMRSAYLVEFALLGTCAGLVAAIGASILSYALSKYVVSLPFHFNGAIFVAGIVFATLGTMSMGWIGTRAVLARPPVEAIRSAA